MVVSHYQSIAPITRDARSVRVTTMDDAEHGMRRIAHRNKLTYVTFVIHRVVLVAEPIQGVLTSGDNPSLTMVFMVRMKMVVGKLYK